MKKRLLSILLAVLMLFSLLPNTALAVGPYSEQTVVSGDWEYTISGATATVTGYSGSKTEITIPDSLDGYRVISIGEDAFNGENFQSVVIADTVETIQGRAFANCSYLKELTLGKGIETIYYQAFANTTSLASVTINSTNFNSVNGHYVGNHLNGSIYSPNIFYDAGKYAPNGIAVTISNNVTMIPNELFACDEDNYSRVKTVKFGSAVQSVNYAAFRYCKDLTSVELNEGLKSIGEDAFLGCIKLASIKIPDSVTEIRGKAFEGCAELTSLVLGKSLETVYWQAFANTTSLSSIVINSTKFSNVDGYYIGNHLNGAIYSPNVFWNAGKYAEDGIEVLFGDNAILIPDRLFECTEEASYARIKSVKLGKSVTSIGKKAFINCKELTSIELNDGLKSIGEDAFSGCMAITSVEIPDSVTEIRGRAFADCTELKNLILGECLEVVYCEAFANTTNLSTVTIRATNFNRVDGSYNNAGYSPNVFYNAGKYAEDGIDVSFGDNAILIPDRLFECTEEASYARIKSVKLGKSVTSIGKKAFINCKELTSIELNDGLKSIGEDAFSGCVAITSVEIPDSVIEIRGRAFADCTELKNLILGECLEVVYCEAFANTTNLSTVTIRATNFNRVDGSYNNAGYSPNVFWNAGKYATNGFAVSVAEGVTKIPADLFYSKGDNYPRVASITFSDTVSMIGNNAFKNCRDLTKAYFEGKAPGVGTEAFPNTITLYYILGMSGWSSPTWNGYQTATWGTPLPQYQFNDIPENAWYVDAVNYAVANGLMNGVAEDTFRPEGTMTRAMLVTVLWRYAGEPIEGTNTFSDVKDGLWYADAVAWAAHNGIVTGVADGRFNPEGSISREQLATILYRYANRQGIDTSSKAELNSFPDAGSVSGWALDAMQWCVAEGIIGGSNGKLLPQGNATRAQVAAILMRFIENVVK